MKTKFILLCFALSCFLTAAYAQKEKMEPIDYNDKLAAITDSLYNMGLEWGTEFQSITSSDKDYSKLAVHRKKISAFATRKIEEIRKGPTVGKGAEELKSAMLQFLTFEKSMIDNAFAPIEKLGSSSTDAEMEAAISKLNSEADKETQALKRVNEAQEKFGALNGFTIEEPEQAAGE